MERNLDNKYLDKHSELIRICIKFGKLSDLERKLLKTILETEDSTTTKLANALGITQEVAKPALERLKKDKWIYGFGFKNPENPVWLFGDGNGENISNFVSWVGWNIGQD